jgi:erythromycin esterase-like protein
MFETLIRILNFRGEDSRAVVWAHNSHVGDARAMTKASRTQINLGQLAKQRFGKDALILGCGTYTGTVAAAEDWGADMKIMELNPALEDSYEYLMHQAGEETFLLDLREGKCDEMLRKELLKKRLERFVGVIYHPDEERESNYASVELPRQFDGYVWFEKTTAVRPLEKHQPDEPLEFDASYPFGL